MRYGRPIRLSLDAYANPDTKFHLVVRTHPEVGMLPWLVRDAVWESVVTEVSKPEATLLVALLMPDHIHVIASPGTIDVVSWMARWKSLSTRAAWTAGHRGSLWQRRFYDRGLRGEEEFVTAMAYILRNPSEAGLVDDDESWPHRWVAHMAE